ncbi:roadblock/LC7 domain-containing protein [Streptomyces sp. PSKA54]|uniref:Roadblock/LC7 domain-containing protein n=1 Tax=Streptomyces himalayensis subsp. aureolus TaxID=2758039 RepID=A0A7W2HKD1_9ACTN|nr:roadblock/LC7 domain-containing protein [Streptomyces himalayensis subsp. aureolus]
MTAPTHTPSTPNTPTSDRTDGAPSRQGLSREARNLHWLLTNLVEEVPGLLSVAVVSSDGLLLLSSDPGRHAEQPVARPEGPRGSSADLAAIVSGVGSLTIGAAKVMGFGNVKQTMVAMDEGSLFVMSISDGSLLGVHANPDCDMSVVAYHMALFVGRAGHVLTPELRSELRRSMQSEPIGSKPMESAK